MKNNKKIISALLLAALISTPFVNVVSAKEENVNTKNKPTTQTVANAKTYTVVYIPSMMCTGCEDSVKKIFKDMGIEATPDYKTKKVTLNKGITEEQAKEITAREVLVTEPKVSSIKVTKDKKTALESKLTGKYSSVKDVKEEGKWGMPGFEGVEFTLSTPMSYEALYTQLGLVVTGGKVIGGLSASSTTTKKDNKNNKDNNNNKEQKVDVIYIPTMMCGGCEAKIKELFKSIGVEAVPDHKTKKVVLNKKVSLKELDKLLLNDNLKKKWPYVLEYKQENNKNNENNMQMNEKDKKVDVIYIPTMMCGGCEAKIKELFKSIGVEAVPDHKTKKVVLNKKVSLKELDKLLLNDNLKKKWPYVLEYKQENNKNNKNMNMNKKESKKDKMPKTSIAGQSVLVTAFCALGALVSKKRR